MGYFVQVLKLACVAFLWGLGLCQWIDVPYALWLAVLAFYLLLVIFVGTSRGSTRV